MTIRNRLGHLEQAVSAVCVDEPLTVVLIEAGPGQRLERRERKNSAGLPVLEIVYDPRTGPGPMPRTPYKLVSGVDPVDLV